MQKPESKNQLHHKGGVRARLFGTRKPQDTQMKFFYLRKPLLQLNIFCLHLILYRVRKVSFERMKARRGFGRK